MRGDRQLTDHGIKFVSLALLLIYLLITFLEIILLLVT
jgi:hypothetical protein